MDSKADRGSCFQAGGCSAVIAHYSRPANQPLAMARHTHTHTHTHTARLAFYGKARRPVGSPQCIWVQRLPPGRRHPPLAGRPVSAAVTFRRKDTIRCNPFFRCPGNAGSTRWVGPAASLFYQLSLICCSLIQQLLCLCCAVVTACSAFLCPTTSWGTHR